MKNVALIGYSGHSLVVAEALQLSNHNIIGYFEKRKIEDNKLNIAFLGYEKEVDLKSKLKESLVFPAIGDNRIRRESTNYILSKNISLAKAIHPKSNISSSAIIGEGSLICQGACINPFALIKIGVIINTGAIIEHECIINDFVHISPGSVLAGNVSVGENSFIGANSVIKQGIKIGSNVIIGAGSVILKDIADNEMWFGNPGRKYK